MGPISGYLEPQERGPARLHVEGRFFVESSSNFVTRQMSLPPYSSSDQL